jgi:hypothetical protein
VVLFKALQKYSVLTLLSLLTPSDESDQYRMDFVVVVLVLLKAFFKSRLRHYDSNEETHWEKNKRKNRGVGPFSTSTE